MTRSDTAVAPTVRQRWRAGRWILSALVLVVAVATLTTSLTSTRPGGRMDPAATTPEGAHALIALLRQQGVDVVVADDIAAVERAARPDALVVAAQTRYLVNDDILRRLAAVPGDRLVIEPISRTREALAPLIRRAADSSVGGDPDCDLPAATRAGDVQMGTSDTFEAADEDRPSNVAITRCYDGALVRYRDAGRTVTVVGSSEFMVNSGLTKRGNAALAMNLAGAQPLVIWYAPQHSEGESSGGTSIFDLIPDRVTWIVLQLCLVVLLVALWQGRRLGPLVAEHLPVVVRASETVEGRARLYRSQRASDRAADALRTAALQRLLPRLGLRPDAGEHAIVAAVVGRIGGAPDYVGHVLFGPAPATDTDLLNLAHALDDIERQVAQS
ncbi:DUF4350 domain-containing protein [Mycolicibacterium moriokaense]|nr:DUF4350 domain-containing protein [Mycolicibacterium moriokaense]